MKAQQAIAVVKEITAIAPRLVKESGRFRGGQSFVRELSGASPMPMINELGVSSPFKSFVACRPRYLQGGQMSGTSAKLVRRMFSRTVQSVFAPAPCAWPAGAGACG
jgi:hypothetical protein